MSGEKPDLASQAHHPAPARRIDHVAIATRDADAAAAWYVDALDMMIVGDEIVDSAGVRLVYLVPRDADPDIATMLQLAEPIAPGSVRSFIELQGEGFHHLCFAVDDLDRFLAEVDQAPDTVFFGGRDRDACFLEQQPLGVLIELTETQPVSLIRGAE